MSLIWIPQQPCRVLALGGECSSSSTVDQRTLVSLPRKFLYAKQKALTLSSVCGSAPKQQQISKPISLCILPRFSLCNGNRSFLKSKRYSGKQTTMTKISLEFKSSRENIWSLFIESPLLVMPNKLFPLVHSFSPQLCFHLPDGLLHAENGWIRHSAHLQSYCRQLYYNNSPK